MGSLLEVKDLRTYFTTREGIIRAVERVSWDVKQGEVIGLVGESGCGKSVSCLSVLRLVNPPGKICGGEVIFNGKNLLEMREEDIRLVRGGQISMIFQEPMTSLNPSLTIERQLTESLEIHLQMNKIAAKKRAVELLRLVRITDADKRIKNYPHQFSGGMRQRIMIAIALSCNPKLVIADEPTTSVDVTIQAQLLEILGDMTRKLNTAVVLITHNLGIVARHAKRVFVMYAGQIIESGEVRSIFRNPKHPYTIGLISSVPRLDAPVKKRLTTIDGMPPNLIEMPSTCSFFPRCSFSSDKCEHKLAPIMREVENNHRVACHRSLNK